MKSYKEMSEAAGTTVEVVRGVAKTIKRGESGAWITKDGEEFATKTQAIEAAAKAWQAAKDARDAHEAARLDMYRQAQDVMYVHGIEIPADPDETMRAAERLQTMATVKGVPMEQLEAIDVEAAAKYDGYMLLTVKAAPRTTVIVRDMARYDGETKTWETAHFGAIPDGMDVKEAGELPTPEAWQAPTMMFGAVDERGDVNGVIRWAFRNGTRDIFEGDPHKDGARLDVEMSEIVGGGESYSMLTLWHERGYIPPMREAWNVDTCVLEADGGAHGGWPNPQHKRNGTTDFEWILEATPANRFRLLVETLRRWAE